MPDVGAFLLVGLAVWRVTHLVAEEDGPWHVIARVRARLGDSPLGTLMDCFLCLSMWVAAPFALILTRDPGTWTLCWLALSGLACLLQRATTRREDAS